LPRTYDPWQTPTWNRSPAGPATDFLNVEEFGSLREAQVLVEAWRVEYNSYRPTAPLAVTPPTSTPGSGSNNNQRPHFQLDQQPGTPAPRHPVTANPGLSELPIR
jgi:Integrase core domain